MGYYLCKHCEIVTNLPPKGKCQDSPNGTHHWVYGSSVDRRVLRLWTNPQNRLGSPEAIKRAADR